MPRGSVLCSLAFLTLLAFQSVAAFMEDGFVKTSGTHFVKNGQPLFPNGFNAYWMMHMASYSDERNKVSSALQQASRFGLSVVRTWAFSDGGYRPLQSSPGVYNEDMFKGLDFVISEARKYGVYLILSLVNNFEEFGGKGRYVQWAKDKGEQLSSDDDFFTNDVVKGFYKSHVETVVRRDNTVTGLAYRDDPTILAWELINEPRCLSDPSGRTLQAWIADMAAHVKSIDGNHLVEAGLEGFYGESMPQRQQQLNLGSRTGSDFISNNLVPGIDFATIHAYPDQWLPGSNEMIQLAFVRAWIQSHAQDAEAILRMPLLVTEFGRPSTVWECTTRERYTLYQAVYNAIYDSARRGGACAGGLFWQLQMEGMNLRDGYEIIFSECPSMATLITQLSLRISSLANLIKVDRVMNVKR